MPESYLKGLEEITAIDPESGPAFVEEVRAISPDFAEYLVEFAWGKVHARNVLEPKFKELIAIATLIGTGDSKEHLRLRILAACRAGSAKEEIVEVIIQSIVHVGFTRALIALRMVKEVADECAAERANAGEGSAGGSPATGKAEGKEEKGGKQKKPGAGA